MDIVGRNVLFFVDTVNEHGEHEERYLSFANQEGRVDITARFFNEVLSYFNYGCENCLNNGFVAIDVVRIIDNGEQVYFDHPDSIEESFYGSNYRE